jgi:hypothetical protein
LRTASVGHFSGCGVVALEEVDMSLSHHCRRGLVAALVLVLAAGAAQAKKSDEVVKATAKADKPDAQGKQTVTLELAIEAPYHLYANPVGNEDLASAATTVKVNAAVKPTNVKVDYPEGKVEKDKVLGDYRIYEGKATIKVHVQRAKDDTSPLEISIKLQACDKSSCLQPGTVKVTVP